MTPNRIHLVKDEFFKEFIEENDLKISEHEAHLYHVLVDKRLFSQRTRAKLSQTSLKKIQPNALKQMEANNYFKGATVFIVHDPTLKVEDKKEPVKPETPPAPNPDAKDENTEKSSIELRQETLSGLPNAELKELLSELTGEDVKGNPKKEILVDEIILAEYRKTYLEKFEEEPADNLTAEEIQKELASA